MTLIRNDLPPVDVKNNNNKNKVDILFTHCLSVSQQALDIVNILLEKVTETQSNNRSFSFKFALRIEEVVCCAD